MIDNFQKLKLNLLPAIFNKTPDKFSINYL